MLQTQALAILKLGHNVYLTGAAGSGKTFVLNEFIRYAYESGISIGVTASTGIAATHMNGQTIHSWAGIGIHDSLTESEIEKLKSKVALKKRLTDAKILIIDEVSMLHGARLDMVNAVCRAFKDASKPFGGLQVVLCGDLFQLPPVTRSGPVDFVFESEAWNQLNLKICYLAEQHRQDDQRLLDVLSAIRSSSVNDSHFEQLQDRFVEPPRNVVITKLYTHNASVDTINQTELDKLPGEASVFVVMSKGNKKAVEGLVSNCLAPAVLELKIGADVMFVANNPTERFANGTRGTVIDFNKDGLPVVQTASRLITVEHHSWKLLDGDRTVAEISQLPLRLAWAITIHKSQGMSLDAAQIDLSRSFEPGMGYVALSRVRELSGLYIEGMNNTALLVHPHITRLDASLQEKSRRAQTELETIEDATLQELHKRVRTALQSDEDKLMAKYDPVVLAALKKWRTKQAKAQSLPAYMVLSDKTLTLLAAIRPQSEAELSAVSGIGPQKLECYADDILGLI